MRLQREDSDLSDQQTRGLTALVLAMFSMNVGVSLIMPLLPIYSESLGASGFLVGAIFAANPFVRGAMMATFGSLADRREKKAILRVGLMGYVAVALGFILAATAVHLLILRILQGVVSAMLAPVARAYAGQMSPRGRQGAVMGTMNAGFFAGFAAGPLIGGVLADLFGMDAPFLAMAGLGTLALILVHRSVPQQYPAPNSGAERRSEVSQMFKMLRNDIIRGLLLMRSSVAMGRGIFSALLPLFAQMVLSLSSTQIGLVVTLRALLSSLLQPGFGRVADRHNRKWLAVGGFALAPLAFFLIPYSRSMGHLLLLTGMLGLSTGISVPALTSLTVDRGRVYGMGRLMGMEGMFQSFAMATGSILGGTAMDLFGFDRAFTAAAVISAAGLLCSQWFLRGYTERATTARRAPVQSGRPDD
ncbi:MAG: MFS transporter [Bacillota bacterium]